MLNPSLESALANLLTHPDEMAGLVPKTTPAPAPRPLSQREQLNALAMLLSQRKPTADMYAQLAEQGVPLDDPTMLAANPQMAAMLTPPAAPQQQAGPDIGALEALLTQATQTPDQQVGIQDLTALLSAGKPTGDVYSQLAQQDVPLDDPRMLAANPQLAALLLGQQDRQPSGGEMFGQAMRQGAASVGSFGSHVGNQFNNLMADTVGGLLYGLLGPADLSAPAPAATQAPAAVPAQQAPAPAPVSAQQVPAQQAPMAQAPRVAQAPVPQMQAPMAAQPADILASLLQAPAAAQQAPTPTQAPTQAQAPEGILQKLSSPQFLTLLQDVLTNTAMDPNWASGMARGVQANASRPAEQQKRELEALLLNSTLGLNQAKANESNAAAVRAVMENSGRGTQLNEAKTQAEINKINSEAKLAEIRAKYAGSERAFTDQNYTTAYSDLSKTVSEGDVLGEASPEDALWSADFRTREKLNMLGGQVSRPVPMSQETRQVLLDSQKAYAAGELSKEEYASRIMRAQTVHGSDAIRKYLSQ